MTDESRDVLNAMVNSYQRQLAHHEGEADRAEQEMSWHRDAAAAFTTKVKALLTDLG